MHPLPLGQAYQHRSLPTATTEASCGASRVYIWYTCDMPWGGGGGHEGQRCHQRDSQGFFVKTLPAHEAHPEATHPLPQ